MFRADHLGLDNTSESPSLEKTETSSLRSHSLPLDLHLEVGPCDISLLYIGMLTGVVIIQILVRQPCCWDFLGAVSLSDVEDTISEQISWRSGSCNFSAPSLKMSPEPWVKEWVVLCMIQLRLSIPRSAVFSVLTSCSFLVCKKLQKEASLRRSENYTCRYKDTYLEYS